ncbi:HAMP domain-containing protein [Deinococcus aetherius]|uniref:HAMP domain-containing protein n=1 Tax=Deinococcus aetherius TaxID=200252 RepID=A0ABM8AEL7_9DEIO|nr:HAMP domain-containing protein [Deinococcus aetherius]BDP42234.1 HAMP domain-containing protein [Deinococcus aetherius]
MKYTVVIRQPVPEEVRAGLEEQLVTRFQLSPEQAARLAARRAGRLMKPTGRARAELLLRVFQEAGVPAILEEVREETTVLSGPFQGLAATPAVPRRSAPEPEGSVALAPEPAASALGVLAPPPEESWADLAAPARVAADPFAPDPFAPPSLLGELGVVAPVPTAAPEPAGEVQASAPPASHDIWSDFTGALTVADSAPKPQETPDAAAETYLTAVSEEPKVHLGPRRSLARQLTFGALAPLALSTAVTLGLLTAILPGLQRQLVEQNAQAVAVAVGTSLDTRDQETVNAQLDALLRRSAVGFVRVELPDGTTYFRSATPELDGVLQGRVARFLGENPETGTFVASGSPADAYREQLAQLTEVGAGNSAQAQKLRRLADAGENQKSSRTSYVVSRLGVVETQEGNRTTVGAAESSPNLLYRIAVGVGNTQAAANLRNTLLLVLAVSLLALGLAASLAVRGARRIVQPIERLVKVADAISMGDLTRPVQPERNDEIGDLSQALERMRLSLEAAMDRLRRRKR